MTILEEIEFLIDGYKTFKASNRKSEYISQVRALNRLGTISDEALEMAEQLFPTKEKIASEAFKLLSTPPERPQEDTGCGSPRGGYVRSSC